jgi:hypothetical protein
MKVAAGQMRSRKSRCQKRQNLFASASCNKWWYESIRFAVNRGRAQAARRMPEVGSTITVRLSLEYLGTEKEVVQLLGWYVSNQTRKPTAYFPFLTNPVSALIKAFYGKSPHQRYCYGLNNVKMYVNSIT